MPFALFLAFSFQTVLEPLQKLPAFVENNPTLAGIIAVFTAIAGILVFFDNQLKVVSSILESWEKIKAKSGFSGSTTPDDDALQARRAKLLKAFQTKLGKRRRDVLGQDQLIALEYEPRPEEVGIYVPPKPIPEASQAAERNFLTQLQSLNPVRLLKRPKQETVELAPQEKMIDVFRRESGRLFILGAPGSGKTTTLLELAQELLTTAQDDDEAPMPIIFELSNWSDDKQSIEPWLVAQLKEEYFVPVEVGQQWIKNHQILPLLDGLDELRERLAPCIDRLNEFLPEGEPDRQAVVCCRKKEYLELGKDKLRSLNGAVELQPLSDGQIQGYLAAVKQPSLWERVIKPSDKLAELAQTPLMLTVMAVALPNEPTATQLEEIFEAYIEARFRRYEIEKKGGLPYSRRQTRKYLERLAKQLKSENKTVFLIEGLQPQAWLQNSVERLAYSVNLLLFSWLFVGGFFTLVMLAAGQIDELTDLFFLPLFGLAGILHGLIGSLDIRNGDLKEIGKIEIVAFSWSQVPWKKCFQLSCFGLYIGLISGSIYGLLIGIMAGLIYGLITWIIMFVYFGFTTGLMFLLTEGSKSDIAIKNKSNQGILDSVKNCVLLVCIGLIVVVLLQIFLSVTLQNLLSYSVINSLSVILPMPVVLLSLLFSGNLTCVMHFALRIVLWHSAAIPWNYATFLQYTSELRLTRQTGGEFRFFHDLLREHFAAGYDSQESSSQ